MKQEMMGRQWHQLDHMQIICTSLQTNNPAGTSSLNFFQAGCTSWCATNRVNALKESKHWSWPSRFTTNPPLAIDETVLFISGWMPYLMLNQQCQSTNAKNLVIFLPT